MFNDTPQLILKKIILRMDYKSTIILKILNKRLNYLLTIITNNVIWQRQYLEFRYLNSKIHYSNNLKLINLIKLLDFKCYSKFLESGFSKNDRLTIFVRPLNGSFIVYISELFSRNEIRDRFLNIIELINNLEYYLFLEGFWEVNIKFHLNYFLEIKEFSRELLNFIEPQETSRFCKYYIIFDEDYK